MESNWIDSILEQYKEYESPLNFWKWAALASISAVVRDCVWLDRGKHYSLYPNIFVMLHADSGLKKGPPVNAANKWVRAVGNTRVIEGRFSIQGMLKKLSQTEGKPGGIVNKKAVAFICSSEMSSSIVEDPTAIKILTDLYDRHYRAGDWESTLKMESFELKDPTITMLTATNDAMSGGLIDSTAIKGGYIARTFIINETKRNRKNALLVPPDIEPDLQKNAAYLKKVALLKGPFQELGSKEKSEIHCNEYYEQDIKRRIYLSDAGMVYQLWYDQFVDTIDGQQIKDPTGTLNRFGDSVLKVGMLYSLARSTDLIISANDMQEAISTCEMLVGNVHKTTLGKTGDSDTTSAVRKTLLIEELMGRDNHSISRAQLNKKYWIQGNISEWDEVALSFEAAGMITIKSIGNQVIYEMTGNTVNEMEKFFRGKIK